MFPESQELDVQLARQAWQERLATAERARALGRPHGLPEVAPHDERSPRFAQRRLAFRVAEVVLIVGVLLTLTVAPTWASTRNPRLTGDASERASHRLVVAAVGQGERTIVREPVTAIATKAQDIAGARPRPRIGRTQIGGRGCLCGRLPFNRIVAPLTDLGRIVEHRQQYRQLPVIRPPHTLHCAAIVHDASTWQRCHGCIERASSASLSSEWRLSSTPSLPLTDRTELTMSHVLHPSTHAMTFYAVLLSLAVALAPYFSF